MTDTTFSALGLPASITAALDRAGFSTPKPIQAQAIPPQLEGRDVLGIAQTGSGKTAAFALPILSAILSMPGRAEPRTCRALVLVPTRELAVQIETAFRQFAGKGKFSTCLVLGGMSRHAQIKKLGFGVDVVIATPGRMTDLINDRKVRLDQTRWLVLDEADRMLDMGFIRDVRAIADAIPSSRQTALFSATMAPEIAKLAASLLNDPVRVEASLPATTVGEIVQSVILTPTKQKLDRLLDLLAQPECSRVMLFTRTKHRADRVAKDLVAAGVEVAAIHGNKSQNARQAALNGFRAGKIRVLVATDIAARGIDVPEVSHVINYELPDEPDSYVHRIGRTARNGASGIAVSLVDGTETGKLKAIQRLIRKTLDTTGATGGEIAAKPQQRGPKPGPKKEFSRAGSKPRAEKREWADKPAREARPPARGRKPGGRRRAA